MIRVLVNMKGKVKVTYSAILIRARLGCLGAKRVSASRTQVVDFDDDGGGTRKGVAGGVGKRC